MSLQDDFYDLNNALKGTKHEAPFERVWFAFCDVETQMMVINGELSKASYLEWREQRVKNLP